MRIKRLEHYTTHDIFESFEELYNYAKNCLEYAQTHGTQQKDEEYHAWEKIMELLGKDIWEIYNPYVEGEEEEVQNDDDA